MASRTDRGVQLLGEETFFIPLHNIKKKMLLTQDHYHQGSCLMGCSKRDNSCLIIPKGKAVVQSLQLNWSFIFIFRTFCKQSNQTPLWAGAGSDELQCWLHWQQDKESSQLWLSSWFGAGESRLLETLMGWSLRSSGLQQEASKQRVSKSTAPPAWSISLSISTSIQEVIFSLPSSGLFLFQQDYTKST